MSFNDVSSTDYRNDYNFSEAQIPRSLMMVV